MKKKSTPAKPAGVSLKFDGGDVAATVEWQKSWAESAAKRIEAGEPLESWEREAVATILREASAQLGVKPKARSRGNPTFERKLPDDDTVALMVSMRMARGETETDACGNVADDFGVDDSGVAKIYRARRKTAGLGIRSEGITGGLSRRKQQTDRSCLAPRHGGCCSRVEADTLLGGRRHSGGVGGGARGRRQGPPRRALRRFHECRLSGTGVGSSILRQVGGFRPSSNFAGVQRREG